MEKLLKCNSALLGLQPYKKAKGVKEALHVVLPLAKHICDHAGLLADLRASTWHFFELLDEVAPYRYGQMPWETDGLDILELDRAIWDVRRYVQPLSLQWTCAGNENFLEQARAQATQTLEQILQAHAQRSMEYQLPDGRLEKILIDANHPARSTLTWKNLFYSTRRRGSVSIHFPEASNDPPFMWSPELVTQYVDYVKVEGEVQDGYRNLASMHDQRC